MMFFRKKKNVSGDNTTPLVPSEVREKVRHIAFIMDGNRRYAKKRGLPAAYGHSEGAKNFTRIAEHCRDIGIDTVTVYAFSTENWNRSDDEVSALMNIFAEYMEKAKNTCHEKKIKLVFLGDKKAYPAAMREKAEMLEKETADYPLTLNIALNYGGRDEIVNAVNRLMEEGKTHIDKDDISSHLYTKDSPDPDIVVRTGGEYRISNFLLWQSAYAEYFFTETLWPELTGEEVDGIVRAFMKRDRRYGH